MFGGSDHPMYPAHCTDIEVGGATGLVSCADEHERQTFIRDTNQGGTWRNEELSEPGTYLEIQGSAGLLPRFF